MKRLFLNVRTLGCLMLSLLPLAAADGPYPSTPPPTKTAKVVVGYFTDWTATKYPPSAIPYEKLTHINYGFGLVDNKTYAISVDTPNVLKDLVKRSHASKVKAAISVGGWTGSRFLSTIASTNSSRSKFASEVAKFIKTYNLDGFDLDWEFPGRAGMTCNVFDQQNDSKNLLLLLKLLKSTLPAKTEISMAVRVEPFDGPNGPLTDVSAYASYLDHIYVMAYDLNGLWDATSGPNAPLRASKAGGEQFSFESASLAWSKAGIPASKIVMGVPFYGRTTTTTTPVTNSTMYVPISKVMPKGDSDDTTSTDPCPGAKSSLSGIWKWSNLRSQKVLTSPNTTGSDWKRTYDVETQTPWLYNAAEKLFISYDDPQSLKAKVDYVRSKNYGGIMIWALNQDSENHELLDVVAKIRGV